ncbi:MAG: isopentenyl phosphate kinase family protein [Thermoplasmatales archaeon]|nr:isopentenyl phosphate kinase family protein [Thermoplasmatales archaeon]
MIIVKIGGSVISNKEKPFSFNKKIVEQIADEIKSFYPEKKFLIVHGGGSYGHPVAKKYKIREGWSDEKAIGFYQTHRAMIELNKKIVDIFVRKGLPSFPVCPSSIFIVREGEIFYAYIEVIKNLIEKNFIPFLYGDVAISIDKGIDILSGDQIVTYIANNFSAEKVIFLMDVDGIYDKNPKEKNAKLIELIDEKFEVKTSEGIFDVTGGIKNKIKEAKKIDCDIYFINGKIRGNLTKAIKGERIGTMKRVRKWEV